MILVNTVESLGKLINNLGAGAEEARKVAQQTIDDAAQEVFEELQMTTPFRTGGLVASLAINNTTKSGSGAYGKRVEYDGYDENKQPYQAIANSLNIGRKYPKRGRKDHEPTQGAMLFIDKAQSKLKGLDKRIRDNIIKNINDKINGR